MGHPQLPTLVQTDSQSAHGLTKGTMKQKQSKAIDMRFHWLKDRANNHNQIDIQWAPGASNLGDYPTKHHIARHHRTAHPVYLNIDGVSPTTMQGCAEMLSPLSQKSHSRHSSPPMTSKMTVQNLLQIIQHNVQQVVGSHELLTTLL